MTSMSEGYDYPYGYDEPEDTDDDLHPAVRRRAERIVHRERLRTFWQWWLVTVGVLGVIAAMSAVLCASLEMNTAALMLMIAEVSLTCYLLDVALRSPNVIR